MKSHRTAGLDQLGPKISTARWQYDWQNKLCGHARGRRDTIRERATKSTASRHVKITLPKLNLPPE